MARTGCSPLGMSTQESEKLLRSLLVVSPLFHPPALKPRPVLQGKENPLRRGFLFFDSEWEPFGLIKKRFAWGTEALLSPPSRPNVHLSLSSWATWNAVSSASPSLPHHPALVPFHECWGQVWGWTSMRSKRGPTCHPADPLFSCWVCGRPPRAQLKGTWIKGAWGLADTQEPGWRWQPGPLLLPPFQVSPDAPPPRHLLK